MEARTSHLSACLFAALALLVGLCCCMRPARAEDKPGGNTHYVDRNHADANDDNPGSEERPWKTLDKAFATVQPGDTVCVKGSTDPKSADAVYDRRGRNGFDLKRPGEPGKTISFVAYKGHAVILDGGNKEGFGIAMDRASFHRIKGFVVRNFKKASEGEALVKGMTIEDCEFALTSQAGLRLRNVEDFAMRDCRVHHCFETGVSIRKGKNVVIERVDSSFNDDKQGEKGDGDGFATTRDCEGAVFIDCTARGNSEDGFDLSSPDSLMVRCVGEGNNACNVKLWNRGQKGSVRYYLVNCLLKDAKQAGIKAGNPMVEAFLYSSVCIGNGEEGIVFRNKDSAQFPDHVSRIADCIFASNKGGGVVCPAGIAMKEHHNLYWNNKPKDLDGPALDATSVAGKDPLFEDAGKGDFRLSEGSPAIGTGVALPDEVLALLKKHGVKPPEGDKSNIGLFSFEFGKRQ